MTIDPQHIRQGQNDVLPPPVQERRAHQRVRAPVTLQIVEFALRPFQQLSLFQMLQRAVQLCGVRGGAYQQHKGGQPEEAGYEGPKAAPRVRCQLAVDVIVAVGVHKVLGGHADSGGNIVDICLRRLTDYAYQTYRCRRGGLRQRDIDGQLRGRGRIVRHCAVTAVVSIGIVYNVRIPCVFGVVQLHQIAVSLRVLRQIEDQLAPVAQRHPIGPGGHVLHVDVVVVAQIDLVPDGYGLRCRTVPLRQQPQHDTPRRQQGQYTAHDPPGRGVSYVSAHFHMLPIQICCGTTYCTIFCQNVQYHFP